MPRDSYRASSEWCPNSSLLARLQESEIRTGCDPRAAARPILRRDRQSREDCSPIYNARWSYLQCEPEIRAFAGFRFHPNPSVVFFNNLAADCQADSRAGDLGSVKPFEHAENAGVVVLRDADSIVFDGENPFRFV